MHIYILCHMIFGLKMKFTRKSRYVTTGCHAYKSDESRYAGFVSRESFHIAFTHAYLNGIDIMAAGIYNSYLL